MKIQVAALFAMIAGASAFSSPMTFSNTRQSTEAVTRFSYLGSLGADAGGSADPGPPMSAANAPTSAAADPRTKALEARLATLEKGKTTGTAPAGMPADGSRKIWEMASPLKVQGGSLKTWSFASSAVEQVQVCLKTEGRPLDADVELWQGPDNTPVKMRVYVEDGSYRDFNTVIGTPRGPNTVAIRNIGHLEFPLDAYVTASAIDGPLDVGMNRNIIQGGALRTYPFDPMVESVQVFLETDGRPLNSRIELLQGPNNNKEVIELYTEDGLDRPFFVVIQTPGSGNVVRVVNTAPVEFPLYAQVDSYTVGNPADALEPVIGGDP